MSPLSQPKSPRRSSSPFDSQDWGQHLSSRSQESLEAAHKYPFTRHGRGRAHPHLVTNGHDPSIHEPFGRRPVIHQSPHTPFRKPPVSSLEAKARNRLVFSAEPTGEEIAGSSTVLDDFDFDAFLHQDGDDELGYFDADSYQDVHDGNLRAFAGTDNTDFFSYPVPPSETDPDDVVRYNPQQTTQPHAHLAVKPVSVCRTISRDNTADRAARDDDRLAFLGRKMRDLTVHGQPHHGPTISATPEKDGDEIMPDGRNMFIYPSVNSYDTVAHQPRLHGGWTTPPSLPPGKVPNILSRRYLEDGPWVPYHYVKETNATSVEKTSDSADIVGTDMDNNDLPAKGFLRNTSRKPRTRSRTSTLPRLHSRVPSSAVTEEGPPSRREAARRRNLRQHPSPDVAKRQLTVPGNDFSTDSVQMDGHHPAFLRQDTVLFRSVPRDDFTSGTRTALRDSISGADAFFIHAVRAEDALDAGEGDLPRPRPTAENTPSYRRPETNIRPMYSFKSRDMALRNLHGTSRVNPASSDRGTS